MSQNVFLDPNVEILVFECIEKYPPIGIHQEFVFLHIHAEIKAKFNLIVPLKEIKEYVYSLYGLDSLRYNAKKLSQRSIDFKL
jgi:hypothetical protein